MISAEHMPTLPQDLLAIESELLKKNNSVDYEDALRYIDVVGVPLYDDELSCPWPICRICAIDRVVGRDAARATAYKSGYKLHDLLARRQVRPAIDRILERDCTLTQSDVVAFLKSENSWPLPDGSDLFNCAMELARWKTTS